MTADESADSSRFRSPHSQSIPQTLPILVDLFSKNQKDAQLLVVAWGTVGGFVNRLEARHKLQLASPIINLSI